MMSLAKYVAASLLVLALVWPEPPIGRIFRVHSQERTAIDLAVLSDLVRCFAQDHGRLPGDWVDLNTAQPEAYFEVVPLDPWGNEYHLDVDLSGTLARIAMLGRDGQWGGSEDDADVIVECFLR